MSYTNAGKSTLFNRYAAADVYAADQLFATLDPTLRRVEIPHLGEVVLADTVGFISDLPHTLIDAFKATLEETLNADLLLHVVDVAAEQRDYWMTEVELVLSEIGAGELPVLLVYNKVDLLEQAPRIIRNDEGTPIAVYLSAQNGEGLPCLRTHCGSDCRMMCSRAVWKLHSNRQAAGSTLIWERCWRNPSPPRATASSACACRKNSSGCNMVNKTLSLVTNVNFVRLLPLTTKELPMSWNEPGGGNNRPRSVGRQ